MALPPVLNNAAVAQELLAFLQVVDRSQRFEVVPTVQPVVVLTDPNKPIVERPAIGTANILGAGANLPHVQLFNPADSGITVRASTCQFSVSVTGIFSLRMFDVALTTNTGLKFFRDRRLAGAVTAQIRTVGSPSVGFEVGRFRSANNFPHLIPLEITLNPGQGFLFQAFTAATNIACTFYWTEAKLETGVGL